MAVIYYLKIQIGDKKMFDIITMLVSVITWMVQIFHITVIA